MKWKMTFEGDYFEDEEEIKTFAHLRDIQLAHIRVNDAIRSRLKWNDEMTVEETRFLEGLQDSLYVAGLD